jgi:hypothetical protein
MPAPKSKYAHLLDGADLSDDGLNYALVTVEGDRTLPADMDPNLQALIREAWATQDRMLIGTLLPTTP